MASDGSGDQGGAAFLEEANSALSLLDQALCLFMLSIQKCSDTILLRERRDRKPEVNRMADIKLLLGCPVLDNFNLKANNTRI